MALSMKRKVIEADTEREKEVEDNLGGTERQ